MAENRKARFDYHIDDVLEAGLALTGTEVKSAREGRVQLQDSYVLLRGNELFVHNMHIAPYARGHPFNHDPYRERKLLLHRFEIDRLAGKLRQRGYTLVPLRMYFTDRGIAKLEIGLARGKRKYDKRHAIAEREAKRAIDQARKLRARFGGE